MTGPRVSTGFGRYVKIAEMSKVFLTQLLCPARHAILAVVYQSPPTSHDEAAADFRAGCDRVFTAGKLNPRCFICGAPRASWRTEVNPTEWSTLAEAEPHLRAVETEQEATREAIRRGRTAANN